MRKQASDNLLHHFHLPTRACSAFALIPLEQISPDMAHVFILKQVSHLFDNEGTVAFAMFMAIWGTYQTSPPLFIAAFLSALFELWRFCLFDFF